jgi:hypothetical protein
VNCSRGVCEWEGVGGGAAAPGDVIIVQWVAK